MPPLTASDYASEVFRCLDINVKRAAAQLMWPWISWNDQTERIWNAIEQNERLCILGHASASKTFTACTWGMLHWWRHWPNCAVVITTATLGALRPRAWSDMKNLFLHGKTRLPGDLVDHRYMIRGTDDKHAIMGLAAERDESASKIQGLHVPEILVIVDEADNDFSNSIWEACANLKASGNFRIIALANPENRNSKFGQNCEPDQGWSTLNIDSDHEWTSSRGYRVLRLDGLRSPNIVAKSEKYPFLLTPKGMEAIREEHGENSRQWLKYVRAWYPLESSIATLFDGFLTEKIRKPIDFFGATIRCAFLDPAFDGGDKCMMAFGKAGFLATNPKQAALQVDEFVHIKRSDLSLDVSIDFANQIVAILQSRNIEPENFGGDSTGAGLVLMDLIRQIWSRKCLKVSWSGSPTDRKILSEDSKPADERFDRFISELCWATREYARAGSLSIQHWPEGLRTQIEDRRYDTRKGIIIVESKKDMKKRGLKSPDEMDTVAGLVHLVRVRISNQGQQSAVPEDQRKSPTRLPGGTKIRVSAFLQSYPAE